MKTARVLLADRYPLLLKAVRRLVESQGNGWQVCGMALTGPEAVAQAAAVRPHIVVIDDCMPQLCGLQAAAQIKRRLRGVEIVIFTGSETPARLHQLCQSNVGGCLLKNEPEEELLRALESVRAHARFRSRGATALSEAFEQTPRRGNGQPLSRRELEVARLLAQAYATKEAGQKLGLSEATIDSHRSRAYAKLGICSIAELVHYAIAERLVEVRR